MLHFYNKSFTNISSKFNCTFNLSLRPCLLIVCLSIFCQCWKVFSHFSHAIIKKFLHLTMLTNIMPMPIFNSRVCTLCTINNETNAMLTIGMPFHILTVFESFLTLFTCIYKNFCCVKVFLQIQHTTMLTNCMPFQTCLVLACYFTFFTFNNEL